MKTMKNIWKLTVVILFCTLGLSNAQAQDKYGFLDITLVDGYGVCNEETNYYAISDPIKNLVLNRQCVQWIWECEDYEYKPMKFEI